MTNHDNTGHLIDLIKQANTLIEQHQQAVENASTERTHLIRDLVQLGLTPTQIGKAIDLTRGRVHQILYPKGKPTPMTDQLRNLEATFFPQRDNEEHSLPCIQIAGIQIYAYFKNNELCISVHYDDAHPDTLNQDDAVPTRVTLGDTTIYPLE